MRAILRRGGALALIGLGLAMMSVPLLLFLAGAPDSYKSVILLVVGPGLIRWGLLQWRSPLAGRSAVPPPHAFARNQRSLAAGGQSMVVPLRLPASIRSAIGEDLRHGFAVMRKRLAIAAGLLEMLPLIVIGGAVLDDHSVFAGWSGAILLAFLLALIPATLVACYFLATAPLSWKVARDLRSGQLHRASGPLCVLDHPTGVGAYVVMSDIRFSVAGPRAVDLIRQTRHVDWGTVDYLARAKVILCVRDRSGAVVYQLPGYPSSAPLEVA